MNSGQLPNGRAAPPAADPREHERVVEVIKETLRRPAAADQEVFGWLSDRARNQKKENSNG